MFAAQETHHDDHGRQGRGPDPEATVCPAAERQTLSAQETGGQDQEQGRGGQEVDDIPQVDPHPGPRW